MRGLFLLFLCVFSFVSQADEAYQLKNIQGDWITMDEGAFNDLGLRIESTSEGKLSLEYCNRAQLIFAEKCEKVRKYSGTVDYDASTDTLLVTEGNGSPTPSYHIEVMKNDTNEFVREWGDKKITYFRANRS